MSVISSKDGIYTKQPLGNTENRDERFLIEVPGIWVPECDIILYGLLNSKVANEIYKIRNNSSFNIHEEYQKMAYFTIEDCIRYLVSSNEELDTDISEEDIVNYLREALINYKYIPCNETMLRNAIIEAALYPFIKEVTLVFPWKLRKIDMVYLYKIVPESIISKFNIKDSITISEIIKQRAEEKENEQYTTIISNEIEEIRYLINNLKELKLDAPLFLLRNHSRNTILKYDENNEPYFEEVGDRDIFEKIFDPETGLPMTNTRFARFKPYLFVDMEPIDPLKNDVKGV